MKVLYITPECTPFSNVGGIGIAAASLTAELGKLGVDIEIVTPRYGCINRRLAGKKRGSFSLEFEGTQEEVQVYTGKAGGVPVTLLGNETYFEGDYAEPYVHNDQIAFYDDTRRFSFFSEACLHLIRDRDPDLVHINDWFFGYLFGRMVMEDLPQRRVMTVHNVVYQGNIGRETIKGWHVEGLLGDDVVGSCFLDPRAEWNSVNPLRLGVELAHRVNTVSPTQCEEMTQPEDPSRFFLGGSALEEIAGRLAGEGRLVGILNGCTYEEKPTSAAFTKLLRRKAGMRGALTKMLGSKDLFVLGFVGRACDQKLKLLAETLDGKPVLEHLLDLPNVGLAVLAAGEPGYESFLSGFNGRAGYACTIGHDEKLAQRIIGGSDVFLMPSLFEPCGIAQMEALRHATPPLVRWCGGLADTVTPHTEPGGTGFTFDGASREEVLGNLIATVQEAAAVHKQKKRFREIQRAAYSKRFLWSATAKRYHEELYVPAMEAAAAPVH